MAVTPQTVKCHHNQGTAFVKETLGSLVSQLWPKKRYVFYLCSWTNYDYAQQGSDQFMNWIGIDNQFNSIQFSMNWIGFELRDFELELNWNWKPELIGIDPFNQFIFNSTPNFTRLNIFLYAIVWKL